MAPASPVRAPLSKNAIDQARELRDDLASRMAAAIQAYEESAGLQIETVRLNRTERADYSGRKRSRLVVELKVILSAHSGEPT